MLSRLSRRLRPRSIYDVCAALALFVAMGGTAYAVNTVNSTDIVDGQVKSVDVANQDLTGGDIKDNSISSFDIASLVGDDVVDGTLTGADISNATIERANLADNVIRSGEVADHSLNDDDVGENAFIDFAVTIGVVPANSCVIKDVLGTAAAGDHILLTTSSTDGLSAISYDAIEEPSSDGRFAIKACNPTTVSLNDGTTHFNALVFAQ